MSDDIVPINEGGQLKGVRLANFKNDSDEPLTSHKTWLESNFVPIMAGNPGARLSIIGMASRNGDPQYNLNLSRRRIDKTAAFILSKGKVTITERNPRGEEAAADSGITDGNRDGFWRAVLLKWDGLNGPPPQPPKPGPQPNPNPNPKPTPKASPGEWWITSVNTFGLPITAGASIGKIALTLVNDIGEQYVLNGAGAGVGVGADLGLEKLNKIIAKLIELGLKAGDIPNIANALQQFSPFSKTVGIVLKRFSAKSGYTIDDITKARSITITSAAAQTDFGGEIGLITFFPAAFTDPISTGLVIGQIAGGRPWGIYGGVSRGKFAAEVGVMSYIIISVDKL